MKRRSMILRGLAACAGLLSGCLKPFTMKRPEVCVGRWVFRENPKYNEVPEMLREVQRVEGCVDLETGRRFEIAGGGR